MHEVILLGEYLMLLSDIKWLAYDYDTKSMEITLNTPMLHGGFIRDIIIVKCAESVFNEKVKLWLESI